MNKTGAILPIRGVLRRFAKARDGVSAVEFALILPIMLTMYLGGAELGDGLAIQFKTTLAARTVADLTSQCGDTTSDGQYCDTANGLAIDSTSMSQILGAASQVMTPYSNNNMVVTVSEMQFTGGTSATVIWSAASSGNGRAVGSTFALPAAMQTLTNGTYFILGEVTYPYTPSMGYVLTGTLNIYENSVFFPRITTCIQYNNVPSAC
jgi:Flp pilus assembly protein TadG